MEDLKHWYLVSYSVPTPEGNCSGHTELGFNRPWGPYDTNNIADGISKSNGFEKRVSITSVFKLHVE